jgi:hypothetical protein
MFEKNWKFLNVCGMEFCNRKKLEIFYMLKNLLFFTLKIEADKIEA